MNFFKRCFGRKKKEEPQYPTFHDDLPIDQRLEGIPPRPFHLRGLPSPFGLPRPPLGARRPIHLVPSPSGMGKTATAALVDNDVSLLNTVVADVLAAEVISEIIQPDSQVDAEQPGFQGFGGGDSGGAGASDNWQQPAATPAAPATQDDPQPYASEPDSVQDSGAAPATQDDPQPYASEPDSVQDSGAPDTYDAPDTSNYDNS
jgi:hypothetical protein